MNKQTKKAVNLNLNISIEFHLSSFPFFLRFLLQFYVWLFDYRFEKLTVFTTTQSFQLQRSGSHMRLQECKRYSRLKNCASSKLKRNVSVLLRRNVRDCFQSWKNRHYDLICWNVNFHQKKMNTQPKKKTNNQQHTEFQSRKIILCVKYICLAVTPRHSDCVLFFLIHACSTSMTCDAVSRERASERSPAHSLLPQLFHTAGRALIIITLEKLILIKTRKGEKKKFKKRPRSRIHPNTLKKKKPMTNRERQ